MLNAQMYSSYQGFPLSPSYATHPPQVVQTLADQRKQLAGIQTQVTSVQTPMYWFGFSDFEDFERKLSHAVAFLQMQPATSALPVSAPPVLPLAAAAGAPGTQGTEAAPNTPGAANPSDAKEAASTAADSLPFKIEFYGLSDLAEKTAKVRAFFNNQAGYTPPVEGQQVSVYNSTRSGGDDGCCIIA